MSTTIQLPLRALNPALVQDLQEKYPLAVVRIEVEESVSEEALNENQFWSLIALLDWGRKRNEDVVAPVVEALSRLPETAISRFDQILAEKLYALDGERFAEILGWGGHTDSSFSPDIFLYARCCAVANGREFYEKVLQDPAQMPKDYTFEPLLYLAEKAFQKKTGTDTYDFLPSISYETFSNHDGWPGRPPLSEVLKGHQP